jgi:hypothetical protein
MWGTFLTLFCLFTGWGEHKDAYGWLRAGEDVWVDRELNFSGDSAHNSLQRFPALLITNYSPSITQDTHTKN